jgi:hypothetical protein
MIGNAFCSLRKRVNDHDSGDEDSAMKELFGLINSENQDDEPNIYQLIDLQL